MKIYSDNLKAAAVVHPGFAVADELEALEISELTASQALGISFEDLRLLCNGELNINQNIASGIEQLGSAEASFWLDLQHAYNLHPKRGGFRVGAGRKKRFFASKQVRISASPEDMVRIQRWLDAQGNTSRALAELILNHHS